MKKIKRGTALLLILALIVMLCPSVAAGDKLYNEGHRNEVCTALSAQAKAYYTGAYTYDSLQQLSGASDTTTSYAATQNNELYDALYTLMSSTQTEYYNYSSLNRDFAATDCEDGGGNGTMNCLWTGRSAVWNGSYFNREHVWPKSHASFYQTGGGADRHHLRPVSAYVNQTCHWSRPYGYAQGGTEAYGETGLAGGWYTDTYYEPVDSAKGDTARILLYVYVRWQQPNLYSSLSSTLLPPLDEDDNANDGKKVIADLETLLEWCALDPVDTWEMGRNDAAEAIQGNRNVFIDYPELAWQLFGLEAPENLVTPTSGVCPHNWQTTVTTSPTCTQSGVTESLCLLCGETKEETLSPLGHALVTDSFVSPTCLESGLTSGMHCTRCDYTIPQEVLPALGHNYVEGICTRCGAQEPVPDCDGGPACPSGHYVDVPPSGNWAHAGIDFCIENGLMLGVSSNEFEPEETLTRAMLVTILYRVEGEPETTRNNPFSDIPAESWYTEAVLWAAEHSIVLGDGEGHFEPEDEITREQIATILFRYASTHGADSGNRSSLSVFPDAGKVSDYANEPLQWAVAEGLITGSYDHGATCLLPQDCATRAQTATILTRLLKQIILE